MSPTIDHPIPFEHKCTWLFTWCGYTRDVESQSDKAMRLGGTSPWRSLSFVSKSFPICSWNRWYFLSRCPSDPACSSGWQRAPKWNTSL